MPENVGIEITSDDKTATGFKSASENAEKFGKKLEGVGNTAKNLAAGLVAFVGIMVARGITKWLKESTRLASIQQDAVLSLSAAYKQTLGGDVKAVTEDFVKFAGELQAVTILGDEGTIAAAAMAVRFGIVGEQLKKTTLAAANMAAATGGDLNGAMKLLAISSERGASMLSRYGIVVNTSLPKAKQFAAALDAINKKFGGAAKAQAESYSGAMKQLSNAWGDFREEIGKSTTESKLFRASILELVVLVNQLTGLVAESNSEFSSMESIFDSLTTAAKAVVHVLGFIINIFKGIKIVAEVVLLGLVTGFDLLTRSIQFILSPLKDAAEILVKLGHWDVNPLAKAFDVINETTENLAETLKTSIAEGAQSMVDVANTTDKATAAIDKYHDKVKATAKTLGKDVPAAIKKVEKLEKETYRDRLERETKRLQRIEEIAKREMDLEQKKMSIVMANLERVASLEEKQRSEREIEIDNEKAANTSRGDSFMGMIATVGAGYSALEKKQKEGIITQAQFAEKARALGEAGVMAAGAMGDAFGQSIARMIIAGESLDAIMANVVKNLGASIVSFVEQSLLAYAAQAAGAALAAHTFMPFVGIAIGTAAAATAFGMVKAYVSQLPSAAMGGVVMGGIPGVDSVGTLVQHGEGVLRDGQTSAIQRIADNAENVGGLGMQGNQIVHVKYESVQPITGAEASRSARQLAKMLTRSRARGF